jgi:hypothetical protein
VQFLLLFEPPPAAPPDAKAAPEAKAADAKADEPLAKPAEATIVSLDQFRKK